jgi:hypothetical protein
VKINTINSDKKLKLEIFRFGAFPMGLSIMSVLSVMLVMSTVSFMSVISPVYNTTGTESEVVHLICCISSFHPQNRHRQRGFLNYQFLLSSISPPEQAQTVRYSKLSVLAFNYLTPKTGTDSVVF